MPRVPTPALVRARADDTFWAALRVTAFTDEQIRAAVHAGQLSDPAAETLLGDVLIKRRDAIGRAYLAKVTPLTQFAFDGAALTFRNVATDIVKLRRPTAATRPSGSRSTTRQGSRVRSASRTPRRSCFTHHLESRWARAAI